MFGKKIEAKIHYPIPIYRQKAYKFLGHKKGDFKISDIHAKTIISFPCDQHLTKRELNYIIKTLRNFYKKSEKNSICKLRIQKKI